MRAAALLGVLALVACDGGGGGADPTKAGDRAACARFQTGPFQSIAAVATINDNPPGIQSGGIAYRVNGSGFVFYGATAAGDYGIFLDAAVTVAVTDSSSAAVAPIDSADSSTECTEVARRVVVHMDVGVYYLELTGVGATPVAVAVEPIALDTDG